MTSAGRSPSLRAIDPVEGEQMWQRRVAADDEVAAFGDAVAVIEHDGDALRVLALDPRTGEPTGTLDDPTAKVGQAFVRIDGASVEAFDERLRRIAGPVELADVPIAAALVGDVVVSAGSGRLRATELSGRERWSMDIDPNDVRYLLPSAAEPGDVLLLSASSITAVDTRGAEPVVRWRVDGGAMVDPSAPGTRYLPTSPAPGSSIVRVVDLREGEVVATVDLGGTNGTPLVGVDGLVLTTPLDAGRWRLEARELDGGAVTWRTELDGRPELVDGAVVALAPVDGTVRISYAGRG